MNPEGFNSAFELRSNITPTQHYSRVVPNDLGNVLYVATIQEKQQEPSGQLEKPQDIYYELQSGSLFITVQLLTWFVQYVLPYLNAFFP